MTILDRVQQIAQAEGITIGAMEKSIGASKGVLSRAINNGTDIQSKWLRSIVENYPQYSGTWLLVGEGEMLTKAEIVNGSGVVVNGNNSHSPIDNRHYYSDSPDVLRAQIDALDERIKEKDAQIKEKDAQIKEKDAQIKEKDAQINRLLTIITGMSADRK